MLRAWRPGALAPFAALSLIATAGYGQAAPQPHAAVYHLALGPAQSGDTVASLAGEYRFEWRDGCDAWEIDHRALMEITYRGGQHARLAWRLHTRETKDGLGYRFELERTDGEGNEQALAGEATKPASGGRGLARYLSVPQRFAELPDETLFPTAQTLALLAAAGAGELPGWWLVFDGWDPGVTGVSAIAAAAYEAGEPASIASPLLQGRASWLIQIGYFDVGAESGEPEQEQQIRIYDNGIVERFLFDYGDFTVDGSLRQLTPLAPSPC